MGIIKNQRVPLSELVSKKELYNFLITPPKKTYKDIDNHFKLNNYNTAKNLVTKYGFYKYIKSQQNKYQGIEEFVKEGTKTYHDVAAKFNTSYRNAFRAIKSRGLEDYIQSGNNKDLYDETLKDFIKCGTKTYQEVADHYNVEFATISRVIKGRNLERYIKEITYEERQETTKETNLERYGVENSFQVKKFRDKAKETILERYGVEHIMQDPEIAKKVSKKAQETMLRRYGKNNNLKSEEGILNARKTLLTNEYRESRNWYTIDEENAKILLDKEMFIKTLESYKEKPTIPEFIAEKDLPIRTVYNYISNNDLTYLFKDTNTGKSFAEETVYKYLLELGIKEEIIRHDRTVIKPYELDIYIPKYKLAIEFNGTYYHSTKLSKDSERHQTKSLLAEERGILLYHIFEYDWNNETKREIIESQLRNLLHLNTEKISARRCEIKEVNYGEAKSFIEKNHLQGDGNLNKQINYGLYYKGELVYIMTFGKWRRGYKGKLDYEIFRSCSKLNTTVIGGASKLFKHFVKNYPEASIGTYSSIQSGDGSLYKRLGFTFSHITKPTAVKVSNKGEVYTLFSKTYQNSRGEKLKAEEVFYKIYGAGNKLWTYNMQKERTQMKKELKEEDKDE